MPEHRIKQTIAADLRKTDEAIGQRYRVFYINEPTCRDESCKVGQYTTAAVLSFNSFIEKDMDLASEGLEGQTLEQRGCGGIKQSHKKRDDRRSSIPVHGLKTIGSFHRNGFDTGCARQIEACRNVSDSARF